MNKYRISGTITLDYIAEVEAESESDATNDLSMMTDVSIGECEDNIVFTEVNIENVDWDNGVEDLAQEGWENKGKKERMDIMIENGMSDDCAYEIAGRDEVPEEVAGYFLS